MQLAPPMKMEHSVPRRLHVKFRRQGNTQKEENNFQKAGESLKSRITNLLIIKYV
jgi:hypothetical protein